MPVLEVTYKFPFTNPKNFIGLASVPEGVGVSTYLGAAAGIVYAPYLTVAGSILTIEARHSSYIRAALSESPFPKLFGTPLDFNQVYSLASQFIVPFQASSPALPFMAFTPLPRHRVIAIQLHSRQLCSSVTFTGAFS
jgi:hypothetical protein